MTKYRQRAAYVEAEQWFKLGDCSTIDMIPFCDSSGDGEAICGECNHPLHAHGCVVKFGIASFAVCPGDFIITESDGTQNVLSEREFHARYVAIEE